MIHALLTYLVTISFITSNSIKEINALILENNDFELLADKTLYTGKEKDFFYVKFTIKNTSDVALRFDLTNTNYIPYPNQWGVLNQPERWDINERRITPLSLDKEIKKQVFLNTSKTVLIKAGDSYSYYTEFNASGKKDIKLEKGQYLYISMDGQLFYKKNGVIKTESLQLGDQLMLSYPLAWKKIKDKKAIINR